MAPREKGISALRARIKSMPASAPVVEVGWPEDGPGGPEVARIAAILMAGSEKAHIPPRPILASVMATHRDEVLRAVRMAAAAFAAGEGRKARGILDGLAKTLETHVRNALGQGFPPGNAAATIAAKGYDFPLRHPDGEDRLWKYLVARVVSPNDAPST